GEKKVITSVPLSGIESGGRRVVFFDSISTEELPPGEHTVSIELLGPSGELIIEGQKKCTLVDQPVEYGKFIINAQRGVDPIQLEYLFGLQYFLKGDYLKALPHLETAALKKPEELSYQVLFIKNLVVLDRLSRAEELVNGLRAKFPHDPQVLLIEATLLAKQERYAEAISRYEEVLKAGLTSAEIYNAMGMLYLNLNNNTKAREAFERSLEIDPSQPEIEKLLAQIKGNY
ncbi:MAG: tetratricopeptide repeat protein, partial [Candidatus Aminicenantes bacterium]|nr:tetratricopeptide repeat protein [Candidatus Aminicenantes bacterium]